MSTRESNFDLLRIIAMFFIVTGHFWHGGVPAGRYGNAVMACMTSVTVIGVNLFFMLSGYFSWQRKSVSLKKLFSLWGTTVIYSLSIAALLAIFAGIQLSKLDLLKSVVPFMSQRYWFMSVYVFIYILSPYLNQLLNSLERCDYHRLLLIMLVVFSVFPTILPNDWALNPIFNSSAVWGIVCYAMGVYLRRFGEEDPITASDEILCMGGVFIVSLFDDML